MARDKASLDIIWLRDESLEDTDNLPPPEVIAAEIVEDLEAALAEFEAIATTWRRGSERESDARPTWQQPRRSSHRSVRIDRGTNQRSARPAVCATSQDNTSATFRVTRGARAEVHQT
jgi:hypothetical protein